MLPLPPQSRIVLALAPVDFRTGIDGLTAVCRQALGENPLGGAVYVFRNRAGTALKLLVSAGQGFWLCTNRLSQGRFQWWPPATAPSVRLSARELTILLWNGFPDRAQMAPEWRQVASGGTSAAGYVQGSHAAGWAKTAGRWSCTATRSSQAFTPAWPQVAIRLVRRLAM
jgi:transposase